MGPLGPLAQVGFRPFSVPLSPPALALWGPWAPWPKRPRPHKGPSLGLAQSPRARSASPGRWKGGGTFLGSPRRWKGGGVPSGDPPEGGRGWGGYLLDFSQKVEGWGDLPGVPQKVEGGGEVPSESRKSPPFRRSASLQIWAGLGLSWAILGISWACVAPFLVVWQTQTGFWTTVSNVLHVYGPS